MTAPLRVERAALLAVALLSGCGDRHIVDQCLCHRLFVECMGMTGSNGEFCDSISVEHSIRLESTIARECRK